MLLPVGCAIVVGEAKYVIQKNLSNTDTPKRRLWRGLNENREYISGDWQVASRTFIDKENMTTEQEMDRKVDLQSQSIF